MRKVNLLAASAAFFLALSTGFAATKSQEKQFADGDKDGDKSLSQAEYVAVKVAGAKKAAEKNKKDFNAEAVEKIQKKLFAKHDSSGDGKLSSDEFFASFPAKKKK